MLKQFKNGLCLWAFASVAFSLSACGIFAGGVGEEQNTVAGANEENNASDPQIGYNPIDVVAPTDSGIAGDPGISIIDTLPPKNSENPSQDITIQPGTVKENQKAVKLYVGNNGASNASMELSLRDTVILIESGKNGTFLINDLPDGTFKHGNTGLYDRHDKVSGKITFKGTVTDDNYVNELWANIFEPTGSVQNSKLKNLEIRRVSQCNLML